MKRHSIVSLVFGAVAVAALIAGFASTVRAAVQQWMDYFQPTPIIGSLSSTCWGAAQVGPRDQSNGLEDKTMKSYNYWDGGIIKDEQTGTYHMFASRWSQSFGHNGWMSDSHCVHATSTYLYGPYTDKGQCFTDNGGMCHNVNPLKLKAGDTSGKKFAITCSGSVAGSGRVYGADSLDGPWAYLGDLKLDLNGHTGGYSSGDNFRTILRPDGQGYECINGLIGLADNVLGPYKAQMSGKFTDTVPGHIDPSCVNNMEDPYLFYSGNQYHVFYNCWSAKKAYFYSSTDGINWKAEDGYGYDPTSNMVRYTDGTINHWALLERPSVYTENGHAVAMTFAAINVPKEQDTANSGNGSKVIVVPVDGLSYDSGGPPGSVVGSGGADGGLDVGSGSGGRGGNGGSGGTASSGSSTGGASGTGGATSIATGGNAGTFGRGEGGATAASSPGGGASGTGGTTSSGTSTGGATGTGGATSIATGGNAGTSGRGEGGSSAPPSATGGARASGGSSGHSDGGSGAAVGGAAGSFGGSAGHGGTAGTTDKSSGCSCTVGAGRTAGHNAVFLLLGLCALVWADRQRRRRP